MPKLSIIIPAYNAEKYIKDCVVSAQNQTEKDIEIIVVNDGSTDSTQLIIENIKKNDSRVRIINQKNQGVAIARNTGIKKSTGDYIVFTDADDIIDTSLAKTLLNIAQDNVFDVLIYSYHNVNVFKNETFIRKTSAIVNEYTKADFCLEMNSHQLLYPVWNKMYNKRVFADLLFRNIMPGEDILFNLDLFSKSIQYIYIDNPLYFYYSRGEDSLLNSYKPDLKKSEIVLIKKWENFFEKNRSHLFNSNTFLNHLKLSISYEILKNFYRNKSPYGFCSRTHIIENEMLEDNVIMDFIYQGMPQNRLEKLFAFACKSNNALAINILYTIITKVYKVLRSYV